MRKSKIVYGVSISPGPNGYLGIFFRSYWFTIKDKFCNFVKECFRLGRIPVTTNHSFIVLIPKKDTANNFNQFKPISLCNFIYKVVVKIVTSRLSKVSEKLVSPNQGAFVRRRWIAENTVIAQEIVHKIQKHKGMNGLMLMKMDMKKAYDRMEWDFLIRILRSCGFDEHFVKLVSSCLNSVEFSLLLNGNISECFKLGRGLRQGDSLSPIIFILGSKVLTRLLLKEEIAGKLHGVKVARNSHAILHLMYTDDLLVMSRASKTEAEAL